MRRPVLTHGVAGRSSRYAVATANCCPGSFVELLELPDGLDLAYLGDTLQEALLRTVDALQHERQARLAARVAHLPERLYENGNGRN